MFYKRMKCRDDGFSIIGSLKQKTQMRKGPSYFEPKLDFQSFIGAPENGGLCGRVLGLWEILAILSASGPGAS